MQFGITIALHALAVIALAWCIVPVIAVLALPGVPWKHRAKAAWCVLIGTSDAIEWDYPTETHNAEFSGADRRPLE